MLNTSKILSFLNENEDIELKKLEKALKLTKKSQRDKLNIALNALNKLDIINLVDNGKVKINSENIIKARIRCSSKGFSFAVRTDKLEDVYIRENHLNHAWHGDNVIIKIIKDAQRRRAPEGLVLCILDRNTTNLISFLKKENDQIYAKPLDDRLLENIKLNSSEFEFSENNELDNIVEVKVNKYPICQLPTEGEILRKLPLDKGIQGDIDIHLTKNNLQYEEIAPKANIKNLAISKRTNLTDQKTILFQGWGNDNSPSLPAFFIEQHNFGTRVWIHSPAISELFTIPGKTESWIRNRCHALCLVDSWRPLLNQEIINKSDFSVDNESEAVSLYFDLDSDGKILDWEFLLTRIKPSIKITREQFEAISLRKPKARNIPVILKPVKNYINQVQTLIFYADKLFKLDREQVVIKADNPIINEMNNFKYDFPGREYYGWVSDLNIHDPNSVIRVITNVANKIWYLHSKSLKIPTISIINQPVENNSINEVIKTVLALNIEIELDENGSINPNDITDSISDDSCKRIYHKILKNSVKDKFISINNKFDDNPLIEKNEDSKPTSPWTLPSTNYLDILNQYMIVLMIRDGKSKSKSKSQKQVLLGKKDSYNDFDWDIFSETINKSINNILNEEVIEFIKKEIIKVKRFNEGIISMTKSRKALKLVDTVQSAYITGVQSYGFFAEIPPLMIEGLIHVSTLNDDWYEYRSRQTMLIGRKNKKKYQLGDTIKVKIVNVDLLRNQVDLEVIEEEYNSNKEELTKENTQLID